MKLSDHFGKSQTESIRLALGVETVEDACKFPESELLRVPRIGLKFVSKLRELQYKQCNHHHPLTDQHAIVNFGDGEFVANKEGIPLLKALNEVGLKTRSHHITKETNAWVCVLLDNVEIEIREVYERDALRTKYNGKKELVISWKK